MAILELILRIIVSVFIGLVGSFCMEIASVWFGKMIDGLFSLVKVVPG